MKRSVALAIAAVLCAFVLVYALTGTRETTVGGPVARIVTPEDSAPGPSARPSLLDRARSATVTRSSTPKADAPDPRLARSDKPFGDAPTALSGLEVRTASAEELEAYGVDKRFKGVMLTSVHPRSPAAEARLVPGDIIIRANKKDITTEASLGELIADREHTLVTVARKDGVLFEVVLHKPAP